MKKAVAETIVETILAGRPVNDDAQTQAAKWYRQRMRATLTEVKRLHRYGLAVGYRLTLLEGVETARAAAEILAKVFPEMERDFTGIAEDFFTIERDFAAMDPSLYEQSAYKSG